MDTNPSAHSIGVEKLILPSHNVANQENTLIPVGMAIRSVVIIMGTRNHDAMPDTNMWCAHTEKPRIRIAMSDNAMRRYPNIGFRAMTEITSEAMPNPGSIMM